MTPDRLRVAYLIQQFPPEVGAGPARVTEMALRWRSKGAHISVITGLPTRSVPGQAYGRGDPAYRGKFFIREEWEGLDVFRSWLYRATKPGVIQTLANNVSFMLFSAAHAATRLPSVDVLIASSPPLFSHISGAVVARIRRLPLVLEIRDLWPDYLVDMGMLREGSPSARLLFALERRLLCNAQHIVVVTESFRERVIAKGVSPNRVSLIPNGVDTTRYKATREEPPLESLKRATGDFIVGYLGTFGAGQALSNVAEAAALVEREDPSIRFVLAGDGLDREKVISKASELRLKNLIIEPSIHREKTSAFYNSCDVCLVPLAPVRVFQDTIPSKIFEVMACERPVLASLGGEGKRIIEASGAGVVTSPGDPRAIADGVLALRATSISQRQEMGRKGRSFVTSYYSRIDLADSYLEILGKVAADWQGSRSKKRI